MAKMVITKSLLTNIANAIREKTGKTAEITPAEMVTEIENIETGGGDDQSVSLVERTVMFCKNGAVKNVGSYAFYSCSSLISVDFPAATKIGVHAFTSCAALTSVDFPAVTSIGNYAFQNCSKLTSVDSTAVTSIGNYAFYNCSSLTSLLLRNTKKVATLSNTGAFSGATLINAGTGYIYVPSTLVESYKTATNWSNYAAHFRALEDYTVDGTTTGALDPTKTGVAN